MFTKKQAIGIIDYLCRDYAVTVHTNNGLSYWTLGDGHKHRKQKWIDTTRKIHVPPLNTTGNIAIHGHYICDTTCRDAYKNYVAPQIEERRYLPCEFEITWMPRHTKKELSRFNETVIRQYYPDPINRNKYLDFKSLLIHMFQ